MQKTKKSALIFIFITVVIDVIGLGIIIPIMPTLIQQLTGGTLSEALEYGGWLMFAYASTQFFFASVLGNLSVFCWPLFRPGCFVSSYPK